MTIICDGCDIKMNNYVCRSSVVYRGCADPRNLPLGVDSSVQCRELGRLHAVWWFCNGTLCNSEQFGTVCSSQSSSGKGSGYGSAGQLIPLNRLLLNSVFDHLDIFQT